jgi:hypothetical protein
MAVAFTSEGAEAGMSRVAGAEARLADGDPLEARGVTLAVGKREEADVAGGRALNTDEAALVCELAESKALGMSPRGESCSSTRASVVG